MASYHHHPSTTTSPGAGGAGNNSKPSIDADKIFVGGLSWQTTEESLRYHFEQYGPVASVEVMRDRVTGDPRGFAFVVFASSETVDLVIQNKPHEINHKIVDVKRAQARGVAPPSIHQKRNQHQADGTTTDGHYGNSSSSSSSSSSGPYGGGGGRGGGGGMHQSFGGGNGNGNGPSPEQLQNKVFVGGLPPSVDNAELEAFFQQFGKVVDAVVMMDPVQQRSRGFGFVTFENGSGGAQKSVAAQPVTIHGRRAEVKIATPKGEQTPRTRQGAHVGLRAGVSSSTGEFAGLAAAFGRNGWKAGYGTQAFGKGGWAVKGWETFSEPPEVAGFSFNMLSKSSSGPAKKRARTN